MDPLGLFAAALITFVGGVFLLAVLGAQVAFRIADRARPDRAVLWPWATLCTATLCCLAAAPVIATSLGESSAGWVDQDHDGMLDGMGPNGSYDWWDVNAGAIARWWLTGLVVIAIGFGIGTWLLSRSRQAPVWSRPTDITS